MNAPREMICHRCDDQYHHRRCANGHTEQRELVSVSTNYEARDEHGADETEH
jgi:hypothetical protein